ncbi:hypothetical protein DFH06DRAFT_1469122 [Mycena polygramma]|nr:hypothetical protein DFH06DRAFT_1469122 [Mycena polygramma]
MPQSPDLRSYFFPRCIMTDWDSWQRSLPKARHIDATRSAATLQTRKTHSRERSPNSPRRACTQRRQHNLACVSPSRNRAFPPLPSRSPCLYAAPYSAFYTTGSGISRFSSFSNEIVAHLKIVELNVWDTVPTGTAETEMVTET